MVWMSEAKLLNWTDGDVKETRKSRSSSGLRQAPFQKFPRGAVSVAHSPGPACLAMCVS